MCDELVKKIRHCATDPMHCLSCGEDKDGLCFKRLMTQAADAIEQLSNAGSAYGRGWTLGYDAGREENKHRWIPVTERLPNANERVIACVKICGELWVYDTTRWNGEQWETEVEAYYDYWAKIDNPVTHWQPLPEPPKEEES